MMMKEIEIQEYFRKVHKVEIQIKDIFQEKGILNLDQTQLTQKDRQQYKLLQEELNFLSKRIESKFKEHE